MMILNEVKYVESILGDDLYLLDSNPAANLGLIAQYYYQSGIRRAKIKELLTGFVAQRLPEYSTNKRKYDDLIDRVTKRAGQRKLNEIDHIEITDKELETIAALNDKVLERLAFTLLAIAKFQIARNPQNTGWVNTDYKTIFKSARIAGNKVKQGLMIHHLITLGLLEAPKRPDLINLRVTFIQDAKPVLLITDMRELGYQYNAFKGDSFFNCRRCGKIVKTYGDNLRKHLCTDCAELENYRKGICVDCGKVFITSIFAARKCRCDDCQKVHQNG